MNELFDTSLLITDGRFEPITDIVPDIDIYEHYWPEVKIGTQRNPFKLEVKSHSLSVYYKDGKVYWKEHGVSGERGDIYAFVIRWYKVILDIEIKGLTAANNVIKRDLKISDTEYDGKRTFEGALVKPTKKREKGEWQIAVTDRGWTKWSMGYWVNNYNICPSILKQYNCGHAKEVWVTPPGKSTYLWGVSTPDCPIFYFHFPKTGHFKCYAPFAKNKKKKWIMNCDNLADIQGYHQMVIKQTTPKLVIITKAMKEVMFYRSFHIDAIAIHGEGHRFNPDFLRHIKKYSENQLSLYDNDKAGKHSAWLLRNEEHIPAFFIKEAKNITDLWETNPKAVWKYIDLLQKSYL